MNKFKYFIIILFVLIMCLYLGFTIYNNNKLQGNIINQSKSIYLIQYGVYSDKEKMIENGNKLSNYLYYEDQDGYHIIVGITSNKELVNKIKDAFEIDTDIYIKEKIINNGEFYENLLQYDKLINKTNSNITITTAEKQLLGKYEELVMYE